MVQKISYCNQKNTPCNINAQRWYLVNAMNKLKTTKNPILKRKYYDIVNYYLSGNAYVVLQN
jgi:predicted glycosyltransferase involved in capsule biosynthesis